MTSVENLNCSRIVHCYADGYDDDTVEQLRYLSDRFGPVSTWSSAERTDTWRLHITRATGELSIYIIFCGHEKLMCLV